jgi:Heterokaryon incompatibility protein (HET)
MRLIHGETLRLVEFADNHIPPYAILSHTWGSEEVTLQDISDILDLSKEARWQKIIESKRESYDKITNCCDRASKDGLEYCWVDTCCIDKSSSSELSEAINSMFRWYSNAAVCYVYLSDVKYPGGEISHSRWFTRGWTLQELIAPRIVEFFTSKWELIGTKRSLRRKIASVTGIDVETLLDPDTLSSASVARRMAWAANRQTTRTEDVAYCLMGLFDVAMPLLYGEGEKAFIRLQEEIIKEIDDHSLL